MKILVLGGSVFLSREVAVQAMARGHEVTCANRGSSGSHPEGARHVVLDRAVDTDPAAGPWAELAAADGGWDAVVDVSRTPSWVRTALAALGDVAGHWTFVSTINVYAELDRPGGTPADTPLQVPPGPDEGDHGDLDDTADPEGYGRNKVACEHAVRERMGGRAFVVRPGLIVGPGDPSGRFTYWPVRLARGGRVLAPAPASDPVQVIDARDLAAWIVLAAETGLAGDFDGVGPVQPRDAALRAVAEGVGATDVDWVWADPETLETLDVAPWSGPRSLPLWIPGTELAGMIARSDAPSTAAGLAGRPLAETARDTLDWVSATPEAKVTGLTEAQEADVLTALDLKPRSRVVHAALVRAGLPGRIVTLPGAATTAPLAAEALGCEVGAIANSLIFLADGEPLLVMASGARRVDTEALARLLGKGEIGRASAEQVRAATGQAIGGVAPVGHPAPVPTVVDTSLRAYDQVWAAGGTPHTVFPMTYAELVALTGGTEVDVPAQA